jgi:hypothetical protein
MVPQKHTEPSVRPDTLTIPELEQSKAAVLNTLASVRSRRCHGFAIDQKDEAITSGWLGREFV